LLPLVSIGKNFPTFCIANYIKLNDVYVALYTTHNDAILYCKQIVKFALIILVRQSIVIK